MVMGTDPPTPMVLVVADALSQFPPVTVVDEIANVVPAVPKLLSVELPVTIPDPEPLIRGTTPGFALRLSTPRMVNVTGMATLMHGAAVHCSDTVPK